MKLGVAPFARGGKERRTAFRSSAHSGIRMDMRAVVFDRPGDESVLRLADVAAPTLRDHDVRIRVRTTSVNRADLLQRCGLYPPPPGASEVLGLECSGTVVEVGR